MRIAVLGLGLIGGSLFRALRAAGHEVTGYDTDPRVRALAGAAGSAAAAIDGTELTFLCVPLPAVPALLAELGGYPGLLSDVTSVKGPMAKLLAEAGFARFVGGHPMAGKELSGFEASDPGLFRGQPWVLCLDEETSVDDWWLLARLAGESLGARVIPSTSHEHDAAVARISHVPHLVASALAAGASDPGVLALAAGSFRDGTRVAATSPALVAAMCGGNAEAVRPALDELIGALLAVRDVLDDPAGLRAWLSAGNGVREKWPWAETAREIPADRAGLLAAGRRGESVT
ncbi:prephenate dehydrogenase [Longispora albida]|uniref:prephenate dehydrogenase n=1 Tax=Longispora albida TaxID=203523 RepID=UPI0003616740|nr:prephenate dehydrogenase/arogenate dehydrogenase family protein [Longispora albida]